MNNLLWHSSCTKKERVKLIPRLLSRYSSSLPAERSATPALTLRHLDNGLKKRRGVPIGDYNIEADISTTVTRGKVIIESAAFPAAYGRCSVTAELFVNGHMLKALYRVVDTPAGGYVEAEANAIAELAELVGLSVQAKPVRPSEVDPGAASA
ncbi:MAG: hypothetical protein M3Z31_12805 [Pseudomonadota bacterium]|nr:hypothetical protein [Pseudomonadota bacterium]